MDTLYIYQLKQQEDMIRIHLKTIRHELNQLLDKDIEKILKLEQRHLNSVLRVIERTKKESELL
jgi:hypothetical protein